MYGGNVRGHFHVVTEYGVRSTYVWLSHPCDSDHPDRQILVVQGRMYVCTPYYTHKRPHGLSEIAMVAWQAGQATGQGMHLMMLMRYDAIKSAMRTLVLRTE